MNTSALPDELQIFKYDFERVLIWEIKVFSHIFWAAYYEIINSVVKSTPNISKNDQKC